MKFSTSGGGKGEALPPTTKNDMGTAARARGPGLGPCAQAWEHGVHGALHGPRYIGSIYREYIGNFKGYVMVDVSPKP